MFFKKKKAKSSGKKFENKTFDRNKIDNEPEFDLVTIYEKCIDEMTLQQAKRDQIITIYLAMFSFVVSYILPNEMMNFIMKGLVFFSVAIIGYGFSLIIVRYRMYKEAYWLCCQALTNLMSFKEGELDKKTIQAVYYKCLYKKGHSYVVGEGENKKFDNWKYFKKNIFSGETIYCLIHAFIVSVLFGIGFFFITSKLPVVSFAVAGISGVIFFLVQIMEYFKHLVGIYQVLVDDTSDSFNKAFSKAWFLHLYVE